MASFVQRLRMANMFPIRSDIGNARVPVDNNDDMYDVINAGKNLFDYANRNRGIEEVGQQIRSAPQKIARPTFGGMVGDASNPGADILARSKGSAEQTYANNNQELLRGRIGPQPGSEDVMGRDEAHLDRYMKRKNAETLANATAANAGNKGWKTVNVTDPNDPAKTTAIQVNDQTGETRPINLGGGQITNKETPGSIQKRIDTKNAAANANKAYLDKTSDSLTLIKDLMDDNDNLTPEGTRATGKSAVGNYIPFTMGYTGSTKINKLKSEQVLNLIGQLKAQSRTGATGMGNMSNKDLSVIERAATLLDTGLPEEEFKKQLKIVKDELKDIQTRLTMGDEIPNNTMKPAVSHNTVPEGKIKVRRKSDGKMGFISKLTPEFELVQ